MKDRIKKIRRELDLTQQEFADRIGIKRGGVANYEIGRNEPADSVISLICREFNVNEDWLRNGNGDMFLPVDRENEISKMVRSLLSDEGNTFKSRFITMLAGLSVSDWERLESEAKKLSDADTETAASRLTMASMEEAEAAYIKSISPSAQKTSSTVSSTTGESERTGTGD